MTPTPGSATPCICIHAPEQHGRDGCGVVSIMAGRCSCLWTGRLPAAPPSATPEGKPTAREAISAFVHAQRSAFRSVIARGDFTEDLIDWIEARDALHAETLAKVETAHRIVLEASRAETREARLVVDANYREIDRLKAEVSAGILASQANARDARAAEDEAERLRGELAELRGALDSSQEENAALAAERNAARSRLEAMRTFDERDADDVGKKAAEVMGICGLESPSKQKFVRDILWELLKLRATRAFLAGRGGGPVATAATPTKKEGTR